MTPQGIVTQFYDTPIDTSSSFIQIHVGGVRADNIWAVPKQGNNRFEVGVVNDPELNNQDYYSWFQIKRVQSS